MTTDLKCQGCDYATTDIDEAVKHVIETGHALGSRPNEGDVTSISVYADDKSDVGDDPYYDEDDDWNAEDQ